MRRSRECPGCGRGCEPASSQCRECFRSAAIVRDSLLEGMWLDRWGTDEIATTLGTTRQMVGIRATLLRKRGVDLPRRKSPEGRANNRFNYGLSRAVNGRWLVVCRDGSSILYSRAVMACVRGRLLRSDEIVHHVNGDWTDDRSENLQVLTRAEHIAVHRAELQAGRGIAA